MLERRRISHRSPEEESSRVRLQLADVVFVPILERNQCRSGSCLWPDYEILGEKVSSRRVSSGKRENRLLDQTTKRRKVGK